MGALYFANPRLIRRFSRAYPRITPLLLVELRIRALGFSWVSLSSETLRVSALSFSWDYFSRIITSPRPTIWSFNHNRYLYVPPFVPAIGGPLSNLIPIGA